MWSLIKKYKNAILNVLVIAAPVVAGVTTGGVFTAPVLIAAGAGMAGKLAASPLDHQATLEDAMAVATQAAKAAAALEEQRSGGGPAVPPKAP